MIIHGKGIQTLFIYLWYFFWLFSNAWLIILMTHNLTTSSSQFSQRQLLLSSLELVGGMWKTDARPLFPESVFPYRHISRNSNGSRPRSQACIFNFGIGGRTPIRHRLPSLEHRARVQPRPTGWQCGPTEENVPLGRPRKCASSVWLGCARRWTRFVTYHLESILTSSTPLNTGSANKHLICLVSGFKLRNWYSLVACSSPYA